MSTINREKHDSDNEERFAFLALYVSEVCSKRHFAEINALVKPGATELELAVALGPLCARITETVMMNVAKVGIEVGPSCCLETLKKYTGFVSDAKAEPIDLGDNWEIEFELWYNARRITTDLYPLPKDRRSRRNVRRARHAIRRADRNQKKDPDGLAEGFVELFEEK